MLSARFLCVERYVDLSQKCKFTHVEDIYKELAVFIQEDLVVYPAQGVGKIEALEKQEIGG